MDWTDSAGELSNADPKIVYRLMLHCFDYWSFIPEIAEVDMKNLEILSARLQACALFKIAFETAQHTVWPQHTPFHVSSHPLTSNRLK